MGAMVIWCGRTRPLRFLRQSKIRVRSSTAVRAPSSVPGGRRAVGADGVPSVCIASGAWPKTEMMTATNARASVRQAPALHSAGFAPSGFQSARCSRARGFSSERLISSQVLQRAKLDSGNARTSRASQRPWSLTYNRWSIFPCPSAPESPNTALWLI